MKKTYEILRPGSSKNILRFGDGSFGFQFTNNFSVFDVGRSEDEIPGKGRAICACAVQSFKISESVGIPTCFVEQVSDTIIRVKEAKLITDRPLTSADENCLVPAEWIYRLYNAGSIDRAFRSGKKKPENFGLPAGVIPAVGTPFPYPVHMLTTKFEAQDRELTEEEHLNLCGMTIKDRDHYWSMIDRYTGALALHLAQCGYAVLDGKLEMIKRVGSQKEFGDVFGTPDEDRPVPLDLLKRGVVEHHSKEFIRQHFIDIGYKDEVDAARAAGLSDPPYPRLPEDVIAEISRRYNAFASAYTDDKI